MLVFLSSRESVEFHYTLFQSCLGCSTLSEDGTLSSKEGLPLFRLHGSMSQKVNVYCSVEGSKCLFAPFHLFTTVVITLSCQIASHSYLSSGHMIITIQTFMSFLDMYMYMYILKIWSVLKVVSPFCRHTNV